MESLGGGWIWTCSVVVQRHGNERVGDQVQITRVESMMMMTGLVSRTQSGLNAVATVHSVSEDIAVAEEGSCQ